jgi:hypothetical protein
MAKLDLLTSDETRLEADRAQGPASRQWDLGASDSACYAFE